MLSYKTNYFGEFANFAKNNPNLRYSALTSGSDVAKGCVTWTSTG